MGFTELTLKNEYRTSNDSVSEDFYKPILRLSKTYDRAVGFFSSSGLANIATGLLPFIKNGGNMRLIASPVLSQEDITAIEEGYKKREDVIANALSRELENPDNYKYSKRLNLLANLIADNRLDIRIALTKKSNKYGIYHEKMGIFMDGEGNDIAFSGSMNESVTAMEANYEAIDVFCSWKSLDEKERIEQKKAVFEAIWNGTENGVLTCEFPEIKEEIRNKYMRKKEDYEEISEEEIDLEIVEETDNQKTEDEIYGARLPEGFNLHNYQVEAIDNWEKNGYQGIFDMATGTGKTFTGLGAVARLSEAVDDKLAVIICCPYQHLVEQWVEDIVKFNINPIIGYGDSKQKDWKDRLKNAVRDQKLHVKKREFFCFVTTNATFSKDYVQEQINKIKGNALLLVDEAHNFGADNLRKLMSEKFNYRLALSATLDRHGDPEGTQALYDYFGTKCIEYDLERAIDEKKLTPYKYYPVIVSLSDTERELHEDLSRQIAKCLIKGRSGKIKLSENGKKLALKRARVVAGAIAKIDALKEYIQPYRNDNYLLVYCGATKVLEVDKDSTDVDEDDIRQIDMVTDLLGNQMHMKVSQFTSREDVEEREVLKQEFSKGENLQALIAIKCLDEGVNIPKIKVAFILASTTNPKEYIQRRGRVLRLAEKKEFAEIYDFITLPRPLDEVPMLTEEQMKRELSLVKNELCRAEEFARLAMNKVSAITVLDEIKEAYNIQDYALDFEEVYSYGE
ncbi:DEAD/DEAH box helicase family protein [Pseudobutyrivibrio sp. LB2011]|uniref:DEAD/DEAH box helicase family protein n=1 Tax=Pseudobutyrivibrio sp. LB2011 TaxID=1408312 RepID=UPI0005D27E7B|nr:DEAD/DEAH box helicase family protein [Pseudobutyrivibrio sp. LB2011]